SPPPATGFTTIAKARSTRHAKTTLAVQRQSHIFQKIRNEFFGNLSHTLCGNLLITLLSRSQSKLDISIYHELGNIDLEIGDHVNFVVGNVEYQLLTARGQ